MKLVIFDFDGTIVKLDIPWEQLKAESLELGKSYDIEIDRNLHMMDVSNILSRHPDTKDAIHLAFRRYESRCLESKSYDVLPGMPDLIKELKAKGYSLAVASANCVPTIEAVLSRLDLRDVFELVYGRESVENNKPAPDQLLQIMEKLGVDKEDVLFVGDLKYDELAADSAGVAFFNISGHGPKVEELRKMLLD